MTDLPNLIWLPIPAGRALIGSDPHTDPDAQPEEQPAHTLDLPAFAIAHTVVSCAQFQPFVAAGGYDQQKFWTSEGWAWRNGAAGEYGFIEIPPVRQMYETNLANRPPDKRTQPLLWNQRPWQTRSNYPAAPNWYEASAYCAWLSAELGQTVQLPSEVEWEYAARGSDGRIFPWGNQWDANRANAADNDYNQPTPVDAYPDGASPFGLLGMAGNVWEWTRSNWGQTALLHTDFPYPYDANDGGEDPANPGLRVIKGGSYSGRPDNACSAYRGRHLPWDAGDKIGFRPVMRGDNI